MKRISILCAFVTLAALACTSVFPQVVRGSGTEVTKTFDVADFSQIELSTIGRVELVQGDHESLEVETDDNIMPYVEARVMNGKLVLAEKGNLMLVPSDSIIFRVTARAVNALIVSSSGSIRTESIIADRLALSLDGSGEIRVGAAKAADCSMSTSGSGRITAENLDCDKVGVDASASGMAELSGGTSLLTITSSGSGDVLAGDLQAAMADVRMNGSGSVTVWATDTLDAKIDGGGSLAYYGQPQATSSVTGSGVLNALGAH